MKKYLNYITGSHLILDMERGDGFQGEAYGVLQPSIEKDEKGEFQYKIYYRDYYSSRDCNCHPETCTHDYGWQKIEYKREKIYLNE